MIEVKANLWHVYTDRRVITTNGSLTKAGRAVMGRGCAREAKGLFPGLDLWLHDKIRGYGNHVFEWSPCGLITFPVKHRWMEPADLSLIQRSAHELVELVDEREGWHHIAMPRPGAGNGRRQWAEVKPILEPILDDRFFVCSFGGER